MVLGVDASRAVGRRTGVGRYLEHLLSAWSGRDLPFERVRVFSPAPLPGVALGEPLRAEVLPSGSAGLRWQATRLRGAARGVDVLFSSYTLPPGFAGRSVVGNLGIYEGALAIPGWRSRLHSRHMAWSARRATRVIANSESTKADVVRFYGVAAERIDVVWPGVAPCFRPAGPDEAESLAGAAERWLGRRGPYLLFVGKLSARRNVPALLQALASTRRSHPELALLLVGPNTTGLPVAELASEHGLDGAVRHVDHLDHEQLAPLYRGALAFVLPTTHEGFSFTIPEALASGAPVLTVEHAALHEAGLAEACLVVERPTPEALAAALGRLVDEPALRETLGRRGL